MAKHDVEVSHEQNDRKNERSQRSDYPESSSLIRAKPRLEIKRVDKTLIRNIKIGASSIRTKVVVVSP